MLERLVVVPDCRRKGVGQELVLAAWAQCKDQLQAMELSLQANNVVARRFFEKQDWELLSVRETETLGLGTGEKMIYRKTCKRSLDDPL